MGDTEVEHGLGVDAVEITKLLIMPDILLGRIPIPSVSPSLQSELLPLWLPESRLEEVAEEPLGPLIFSVRCAFRGTGARDETGS